MTSRSVSGTPPRLDEDIDSPMAWEPSLAFLRYASWFMLAGSAVYIAGLRILAPTQTVRPLVVLLLLLLSLAAWFLLARGKVRAAVQVLATGVWAYVTVTSFFVGGVSAAAVVIYPLIILLVGWLVGTQTAVAIAVATVVATFVFAILEWLQFLPTPLPTHPILRWMVQCGVFLLSAILIGHVVRSYRNRLEELRRLDRDLAQRTAELEAREADLNRAQAVAHVGSWEYELAADTMQMSAEACRIFGVPAGTLGSHDTYLSRVVLEDRDALDEAWQAALQSGARFEHEHRIVVGESARWVRQIGELERDADGKPLRSFGTTEDITERKRREADVLAAQGQLAATLDAIPDLLFEVGLDGRYYGAHSPDPELLAAPPESLVGRSVADVLPPAAAEVSLLALSEADKEGRSHGRQIELPLPTGKRWFELSVSRKAVEPGRDPRFIVLSRDITARKRAEESLRESEAQLECILASTADGLLAVNQQGRVIRTNRRFAELWRIPQLLLDRGDDQALLAYVLDQLSDPGAFLSKVQALYRTDAEFADTIGFKDGRVFERYTSPLLLNGSNVGRVWSFRDITERKRVEAERAALEAQLQQAQKIESVGRLAGGVAHDFNNMLSVILGHAELALLQADPAQPLHADLEEIRSAATRSADLTRQLLAFARKQRIVPTVLDLNATVTVMLSMLQRLIGENIHIRWQPAADLWPVRMDPSQLDQILTNLCVNARDAIAGNGQLTIETSNRSMDIAYCARHVGMVPGDYVRLAVRDDGCGMDKDTLARLFEPFFTTKEFGQGAGLGLASVYGAVKQNGGFIEVESAPGEGTTFTIFLHRHAGTAAQPRTEVAVAPLRNGRETILLVEDEPAILTMATAMLERQGYTVLAAATPDEALRIATAHSGPIHLLMTDVVMPRMNGAELARHVLARHPDVKRLFMSGYTADIIAHHGVVGRGSDFIQKPFAMRDLAAKIRDVLEQKQG